METSSCRSKVLKFAPRWGMLISYMSGEEIVLSDTEEFVQHLSISKPSDNYSVYIQSINDVYTTVNDFVLKKNQKYMLFHDDVVCIARNHVYCFKMVISPKIGSESLPEKLQKDFYLGDIVAHGAFKTTYVAFDKNTWEAKCLKEVRTAGTRFRLTGGFAAAQNMFLMQRDHIESDDRLYLVTKYHRESNLEAWVGRGMDMPDIKFVFSQIVLGVEYLHDVVGVHHGRLKPQNVFIVGEAKNPIVKITDFSLPRIPGEAPLTHETPFVAPEEVDGHPLLRKLVDVWCLGEILHFMCHKAVFFVGEERLLRIVVFNILNYFGMNNNSDANTLGNLLAGMINVNVVQRFSLDQVKVHSWFTDDVGLRYRIHDLKLKLLLFDIRA